MAVGEQTKEVLRQARLEARDAIHNLRAEGPVRRRLGDSLRAMVEQARLSGRAEITRTRSGNRRQGRDPNHGGGEGTLVEPLH